MEFLKFKRKFLNYSLTLGLGRPQFDFELSEVIVLLFSHLKNGNEIIPLSYTSLENFKKQGCKRLWYIAQHRISVQ